MDSFGNKEAARIAPGGLFVAVYSAMLNCSVTLNRSPSTVSSSRPFCSCTRLRAMLRPRPLPSVLRELSPRTKRYISSSPLMFSWLAEMFRKVTTALPRVCSRFR